jgi:hypothetical protein
MSIMSQDDRDVVILASTIRGGVKCVHSIERNCGYIIRPELWFTTIEGGAGRALTNHGLEIRSVYSKPKEITTILNVIRGLEDLSSTTEGLHLVRELNGVLRQPTNHKGVLSALEMIESSREIKSSSTFRHSPEARNDDERRVD